MIVDWQAGNVFILDFDQFGNEAPEMVGRRMVAVVTSKTLRRDRQLVTIVPLSATAPTIPGPTTPHSIPLSKDYTWSPRDGTQLWAKCDMITTVSTERLDHLAAYNSSRGKNHIPVPRLSKNDLRNIRLGVAQAIELGDSLRPNLQQELLDYLARFRKKVVATFRKRSDKRPAPSLPSASIVAPMT